MAPKDETIVPVYVIFDENSDESDDNFISEDESNSDQDIDLLSMFICNTDQDINLRKYIDLFIHLNNIIIPLLCFKCVHTIK